MLCHYIEIPYTSYKESRNHTLEDNIKMRFFVFVYTTYIALYGRRHDEGERISCLTSR